MRLVDLRDSSRERACIDDQLHGLLGSLHSRSRNGVTKPKVVDDDVHEPTLSRVTA